jgi:hypothetical protein
MEYVHYGYQMKKRYAKLTVDFKAGSDNNSDMVFSYQSV